jgi:hypothetical protein
MFGDFSFNIIEPQKNLTTKYSNSNLSGKSVAIVPAKLVFSHIKKSLVQPKAIMKANVSSASKNTPANTMHAPPFCSRCLSEGHRGISCGNLVHCLWCFVYGHKEKRCFRRRVSKRTKWMPKVLLMKDTSATLESGRDILLPRKQCGVKR